ncbi:MAG: helix-turn-helix domain-containing protein [Candidatus Xenobia bacterium]
MKDYLTPEEIARLLKVTRRTVYDWLSTGQMQGLKAGRGWRVPQAAISTFMKQRFVDDRTEDYEAAVSALLTVSEHESADRARRAFAEAFSIPRLKSFAARFRPLDDGACIHRVAGKECNGLRPPDRMPCSIPGGDHDSMWVDARGRLVYVSQPYSLSGVELKRVVQYCEREDLELEISTADAWHFPGWTMLMRITKRDT